MKEFFNDYVQSLETYIMFQIKAETARLTPELEKKGRKPISLSMGAPVKPVPPFVVDKLKEALDMPGIHTYSTPKGEAYFLEAAALRMKNRFNVDINPKTEIFSLIGSKEGIANIIRELINPKTEMKDRDIIMIPDPGYASYKEMIKVSGGNAYPVCLTPQNKYMPNLEETLEQLKKDGFDPKKVKALVINYPNNPLGAVATSEYLESVVDFCKKHNIMLLSDAAYADMYFEGTEAPHSILEFEGARDIAVEFFSFSKPYAMTGWRMGWVCGNSEIISMFGKMKSTIDTGIFKALQYAGSKVLNSNEGDEYIIEANRGFEEKQKILTDGFKELGWDVSDVPKATFYLWLAIPPSYKTSKEFTDKLLEKSGIVVVPGHAFGDCGEGFFRISVVADNDALKEVIERMKLDGFSFNS